MNIVPLIAEANPWWSDSGARRARRFPARRKLQSRVLRRATSADTRRALLIRGTRQVGKTVLLWQVADDLLDSGWPPGNVTYFDFSDDRLLEQISPREVVDSVPAGADPRRPRVFLLDEIGNAQGWDRWLKQAVDSQGSDHRFLVTDSSARLLRSGSADSGQGRFDEVLMEGLSYTEWLSLNAREGETPQETRQRIPAAVERYLRLGGYPEHATSESHEDVRRRIREDIADRAILRDLQHEGLDLPRLRHLFVYLMQESGSEFVAAKWKDVLGADPRTVAKWIEVLEHTMLVSPLSLHARSAGARLRSHRKLYASDHGIVTAFATGSDVKDERLRGRVLEAVVFRHLRELAREHGADLGYYRAPARTAASATEADFVVQSVGAPIVIEVTGAREVRPDKVRTLMSVGSAVNARRCLLVHGGVVEKASEAVVLMPVENLLLDPEVVLGETR